MEKGEKQRYLENKLREALASGKSKPSLALLAALVLALLMLGPKIIGSDNKLNFFGQQSNVGSITVYNDRPLRYWSELSEEEKVAIKQEARHKFPEIIENKGKYVSWKPITKWLNEEKRVVVADTRSLF